MVIGTLSFALYVVLTAPFTAGFPIPVMLIGLSAATIHVALLMGAADLATYLERAVHRMGERFGATP